MFGALWSPRWEGEEGGKRERGREPYVVGFEERIFFFFFPFFLYSILEYGGTIAGRRGG